MQIQSLGEERYLTLMFECIGKIRNSNTDIRISFTYKIIVAKIYQNYKCVKYLFDVIFATINL